MAGRPPNFEWISRARQARALLQGVSKGDKEAKLQEAAGEENINTVRRSIRALEFLERWIREGKASAKRLEAVPQSILEVLSQWATFDQDGAWDAFLEWETKRLPSEALADRMREKKSEKGVKAAKAVGNAYRKKFAPYVQDLISAALGPQPIATAESKVRRRGEPAIDFRCILVHPGSTDPAPAAAIVIVGPYGNVSTYKRLRYDWLQKAFCLAWIYEHVILVLPDEAICAVYAEWVNEFSRKARAASPGRVPHVHVAVSPTVPSKPSGDPSSSRG